MADKAAIKAQKAKEKEEKKRLEKEQKEKAKLEKLKAKEAKKAEKEAAKRLKKQSVEGFSPPPELKEPDHVELPSQQKQQPAAPDAAEPKPQKEAAAVPAPAAQSVPEPTPAAQSVPEPTPAAQAAPEPEPAKIATPAQPEPEPEPAPTPAPAPQPEPAPAPAPAPQPEAAPAPAPAPSAAPAQPEPESAPAPAPADPTAASKPDAPAAVAAPASPVREEPSSTPLENGAPSPVAPLASDGGGGKAVTIITGDQLEPVSKKSGLLRSGSARRSLRGAPKQPQVAGVTAIEVAAEAAATSAPQAGASNAEAVVTEEMLGKEIVEDAADDQVGSMQSEDALQTAAYLQHTVEKLKARMSELFANGTNRGYSVAYQALGPVGRQNSANACLHEANKLKNRYGNITAYDHSRVRLPPIFNDPTTDYINANWINGYKRKGAYIASQGPVPNSFISFWRMIWHCKIEVIVMVTHEVEKGRMKCHRYWPDPTSSPPVRKAQYGSIIVTHLSSVPHKNFIVRHFEVEFEGSKRVLKQFAYTSWPDHGVPLTTQELLGFRNAVRVSVTQPDAPLLIHCSAGVGRTGTYIALDRLVQQALDMGGDLSVDHIIADMRMARNFMVQTEVQYIFIYRAVLDALSALLSGESSKASATEQIQAAEAAAKKELEEAQAAAERENEELAKRQAEEQAAIDEARKEMLGKESSAAAAQELVGMSIKERMAMLDKAEERWLEAYKQSLEEWSERNQFEAEEYDLTSSLTPIQSRIEALKQKGMM